MTATDERAAGTGQELDPVAPGSLAYVTATTSTKWDLAKLAGMLREEAPAPVEPPKIEVTAPVRITAGLKAALRRLPEVFGSVVPTEPRRLEQAELDRLTDERDVIAQVITALGKRDKDIDEAVRHHMDTYASEDDPVIATGVARGHRLLAQEGHPFEARVTGMSDAWQQRRVAGKAELSIGLLADLLAAGTITRAEFNALTVPVRELDEARVRAATRKSPARYLSILRAITVRKGDTAQLVPPKK